MQITLWLLLVSGCMLHILWSKYTHTHTDTKCKYIYSTVETKCLLNVIWYIDVALLLYLFVVIDDVVLSFFFYSFHFIGAQPTSLQIFQYNENWRLTVCVCACTVYRCAEKLNVTTKLQPHIKKQHIFIHQINWCSNWSQMNGTQNVIFFGLMNSLKCMIICMGGKTRDLYYFTGILVFVFLMCLSFHLAKHSSVCLYD